MSRRSNIRRTEMQALSPIPAATRIHVYRAKLPASEALLPYLSEIDGRRWYSNHGLLVQRFQTRIGAILGVGDGVITAASGWAALQAAILAAAGRASPSRPLAIMPSYTFVATALAAEQCGYLPYFVDVGEDDWVLTPQTLEDHPALSRAGVVIPVAAYGRGVAQEPWLRFRQATGIPVVVDAAAAFAALSTDPDRFLGDVPVALSFHATKPLSTGEGGAVVWSNIEGTLAAAKALNFGFLGSRECTGPSFNGRMSEYHAAIGNASLDEWDATRAKWHTTISHYARLAAEASLADRLILPPTVATSYALFRCEHADEAARVAKRLATQGIDHRHWYGLGLHTHAHFAAGERDNLPVTDRIAPVLIGLPSAIDLELEAIQEVVAAVQDAVG
jgi:dTDP-4-amino-4,6-dideoxygalactose transaminase